MKKTAQASVCACVRASFLYVRVRSPSTIPQFSGALRLINGSAAVGDVRAGAAYSYHYS